MPTSQPIAWFREPSLLGARVPIGHHAGLAQVGSRTSGGGSLEVEVAVARRAA